MIHQDLGRGDPHPQGFQITNPPPPVCVSMQSRFNGAFVGCAEERGGFLKLVVLEIISTRASFWNTTHMHTCIPHPQVRSVIALVGHIFHNKGNFISGATIHSSESGLGFLGARSGQIQLRSSFLNCDRDPRLELEFPSGLHPTATQKQPWRCSTLQGQSGLGGSPPYGWRPTPQARVGLS